MKMTIIFVIILLIILVTILMTILMIILVTILWIMPYNHPHEFLARADFCDSVGEFGVFRC